MKIDAKKIGELLELCEKATPGEWLSDGRITGWRNGEQPACRVAHWRDQDVLSPICMVESYTGNDIANAAFIAAAREAMPELLSWAKRVLATRELVVEAMKDIDIEDAYDRGVVGLGQQVLYNLPPDPELVPLESEAVSKG